MADLCLESSVVSLAFMLMMPRPMMPVWLHFCSVMNCAWAPKGRIEKSKCGAENETIRFKSSLMV